jgi:amino acid adenylation domain-containing protein
MGMDHLLNAFMKIKNTYPDNIALCDKTGAILTYGELDNQSSSLAHHLKTMGIGINNRVGVVVPRVKDSVIIILAILKSGAAYVPLDPTWPDSRIIKIIKNCDLSALFTFKTMEFIDQYVNNIINISTSGWEDIIHDSVKLDSYSDIFSDDNLAYILYTSGSTGDPKGVSISHRAASFFANWAVKEFELTPNDKIAAVSPFTFDLSTFDLFAGLSAGCGIFLVDEQVKMFPSQFSKLLEEKAITVLYSVPSTLILLTNRGSLHKRNLNNIRLVLFAGEVFPIQQFTALKKSLPDTIVYYNLYGPTETNVCTFYKIDELTDLNQPLPIGKPLPGIELYCIPENNSEYQDGNAGELCVAGPCLMNGYWNNQSMNQGIWIDVNHVQYKKAYRTGDFVEKSSDGNWLYKGRIDGQIKHLGYRIEPGEVESCLIKGMPGSQVKVLTIIDQTKTSKLAAFFTYKSKLEKKDTDLLFEHCWKHLPPYMVPEILYQIEEMPLTDNGKINLNKLKELMLTK